MSHIDQLKEKINKDVAIVTVIGLGYVGLPLALECCKAGMTIRGFDVDVNKIEVVIHPQSIIHSAVQFEDGSLKAQLGLPDMKLPIQYALGFPKRIKNTFKRFSFFDYPHLTFEKPDFKTFKNLELSFYAIEKGGNLPCVLNAANEVAVALFLEDKISFLKMSDLIANCMEKITFVSKPTLLDYIATNEETKKLALEF